MERDQSNTRNVNVNSIVSMPCDSCDKIKTVVSLHRDIPSCQQNGGNPVNLTRTTTSIRPMVNSAVLNVCNKAVSHCEYVKDHNFDSFELTETWLNHGDESVMAKLMSPEYSL